MRWKSQRERERREESERERERREEWIRMRNGRMRAMSDIIFTHWTRELECFRSYDYSKTTRFLLGFFSYLLTFVLVFSSNYYHLVYYDYFPFATSLFFF